MINTEERLRIIRNWSYFFDIEEEYGEYAISRAWCRGGALVTYTGSLEDITDEIFIYLEDVVFDLCGKISISKTISRFQAEV